MAVEASQRPAVLIVDDDPVLCAALSELLEMAGNSVTVASAGPAAITALERSRFRLVVLDIGLQHIDGVHLARFIRRHWPDTRIALHTGTAEADIRARFDDYDAFWLKPQPLDALLATVGRLTA